MQQNYDSREFRGTKWNNNKLNKIKQLVCTPKHGIYLLCAAGDCECAGLVCLVGDPSEPVGLLLTEPSEQLPSQLSGFLLFLLDNRL